MISVQSRSIALSLILVLSLTLRLTAFGIIWSKDPSRILTWDSLSYDNTAQALLSAGHYAVSPEEPNKPQLLRTPGYPVFIAFVYLIFGRNHAAVILLQCIVSVITVILIYLIAIKLRGPREALLSVILLSLDPLTFVYSQMLLTETLFTFFIAVTAWLGIHFQAHLSQKKMLHLLRQCKKTNLGELGFPLALGISIALATMVRPISYYLIIPILAGIMIYARIIKYRWRQTLLYASLTVIPWLILVGGWQIRNYIVIGSAEFSYIQAENLLNWRAADVIARRDDISLDEARQKIHESLRNTKNWGPGRRYDFYQRKSLSLILSHPLQLAESMVHGIIRMALSSGSARLGTYLGVPLTSSSLIKDLIRRQPLGNLLALILSTYAIGYLLLLYFSIACCLLRLREFKQQSASHLFLWGIIFYLFIVSAGPEAYFRFRTPIMPLLSIYGGMGLSALSELVRRTVHKNAVFSAKRKTTRSK